MRSLRVGYTMVRLLLSKRSTSHVMVYLVSVVSTLRSLKKGKEGKNETSSGPLRD